VGSQGHIRQSYFPQHRVIEVLVRVGLLLLVVVVVVVLLLLLLLLLLLHHAVIDDRQQKFFVANQGCGTSSRDGWGASFA
jgi:uncharacterized membrane protein YqiK